MLNLACENVDEGAAQNAADLVTATLIAARVAGVALDELHRCLDTAAPVVDEAFRTRPDVFGGPVLQ